MLSGLLEVDRISEVAAPPTLTAAPLPLGETRTAALIEAALSASPDLRSARADVEKAEAEVARARAGHWPSVEARADGGYDSSGFPQRQDLGVDAGVYVRLPVFEWGRVDRDVERAEQRLEAARAKAEQADVALRRDVRDAVIARDVAAEAVARGIETLASCRRIVDQSRTGFENGVVTNLELLDAWQQMTDAELALEDARFDARVAEARLLRLSGEGE